MFQIKRTLLHPHVRTGALRSLFFLGILYQLLLPFRSDDTFFSKPYIEDAFYSLSVARSLAHGKGISVDGLHPTNGLQPLISFLNAPFFALSKSDIVALRFTVVLQVLVYGMAALIIGWFMLTLLRPADYHKEIFWGTAILILYNYSLSTAMLNGLETGLAVAMAFLAVAYYNSRIADSSRPGLSRFAILGVILGIGVLTRIDLALLVPCILCWHILRRLVQRRVPERSRQESALGRIIGEVVTVGALSIAISLPWWIYNVVVFGSLMPISGQALQLSATERWSTLWATVQVFSNALLFPFHLPRKSAGLDLYVVGGAVLTTMLLSLAMLFKSSRTIIRKSVTCWQSYWDWRGAIPLLLYSALLIFYYTFFFNAPHFQGRYLVTPRLVLQLGILSFFFTAWSISPSTLATRYVFAGALTLWVMASAILFGRNFTTHDVQGNIFLAPAHWIAQNTTPSQKIGMFQSGTTGFLFSNVTNLDGKVNSDALAALKQRRMPAYVDSMAFDYIIDWQQYVAIAFADTSVRARYHFVDTLDGGFYIWKRIK